MSILSIISNSSERLFSYHSNFTICLLVNFFIIVIPMDCGTLMGAKKDWYREGGKSCIIHTMYVLTYNISYLLKPSSNHLPFDFLSHLPIDLSSETFFWTQLRKLVKYMHCWWYIPWDNAALVSFLLLY